MTFRTEFLEITRRPKPYGVDNSRKPHQGIEVLRECTTIASVCLKHYRTNYLNKNTLAVVPERGYDTADSQSTLAMKYMQWYAEKNNVKIQTAHSPDGEKKVENYKLDGWIEEQQLGIEVNGCCWHGCSRCYPSDQVIFPIVLF